MKNFWKYALIGIMAICLLFSFTACDDDDDDDDVVYCTLEDETITNLVASALVSAITDNLVQSTTGYTSTYSAWTPVMDSDYTEITGLTITVTSAYTEEVTIDGTNYYTVVIKKGSDIEVDLSTYYVEVDVDSTIDGAEADIDLEGDAFGTVSEFDINDTASTYNASSLLTTLVDRVTTILTSSPAQSE